MSNPDILVIGGGPAGQSAAVRAAQQGATVALIEEAALGGTCLNRGCIPTKFLWEALALRKRMGRAADFGIESQPSSINFSLALQKKNKAVTLLAGGVKRILESHGVRILSGAARFTGPYTVEVKASDGSAETLSANKIIIAAGSRPAGVRGLEIDHNKVIDSTDFLNLTELPAKLLIVGGGAIGVELAGIAAGFGSQVTLVEREAQLVPGEDPEAAQELKKLLERQGITVVTACASLNEYTAAADKVLVAAGRKPNSDLLDPAKSNIECTPRGIAANEYGETSCPGIYAAGDIAGKACLAYTASEEGALVAENALGGKRAINHCVVPRVVFSNPPLASVGITADAPGTVTGRFPFTASGRAFISGERTGWVKVSADKTTGVIRGITILGGHAEEMIAAGALAVSRGITLEALSRDLFFHPSLSEAMHAACEDALGRCVDIVKAGKPGGK